MSEFDELDAHIDGVVRRARETERAAIVAWLREAKFYRDDWARHFANAIEAGDHLKGSTP